MKRQLGTIGLGLEGDGVRDVDANVEAERTGPAGADLQVLPLLPLLGLD